MAEEHRVIDAEKHYYERMKVFEKEIVEPDGIVLVGSSHFEWFDTDRFLPGRRIVNRGIASDRLGIGDRGILHRLDTSVFDLQPAMIIFNNGVNDLGELWHTGHPRMETIFEAYDHAVRAIRAGMPDVPMLIINELPTSGRFAGLNAYIPQLNARIFTVADRHGCTHLDFHSEIVNGMGALPDELTDDGLHLNDAGYTMFAEKLNEFLPPARV